MWVYEALFGFSMLEAAHHLVSTNDIHAHQEHQRLWLEQLKLLPC